jgi:anti-sigma regulatory factor (Ser/Thr protein kinase)
LEQPGRPAQHVTTAGSMLPCYARVVHQEPVIAPSQWPEWRRLEAVLNLVLRHYDTWAVCAYDQHTLTANMVEDLQATHPLIGQDGHHRRNDRYRHPVNFLGRNSDDPPDPIERTPPAVELVDPSAATARAAVKWFSHQQLPGQEIDKLIYATHEAVTNALQHGRPPTVLRLWAQPGRVTVTVTDAGPGPTDPLADPLAGPVSTEPPTDSADDPFPGPALGLWLIHQLVDVTRRSEPSGYTICLTATHPDDHAR